MNKTLKIAAIATILLNAMMGVFDLFAAHLLVGLLQLIIAMLMVVIYLYAQLCDEYHNQVKELLQIVDEYRTCVEMADERNNNLSKKNRELMQKIPQRGKDGRFQKREIK